MRAPSFALMLLISTSCFAGSAWAFDPNAGAEDVTPARYKPLPSSVVPSRYYQTPPVTSAAAASAVPIVYSAPQAMTVAPLPAPAAAAAANSAPVNYYAQPATATTYVAPAAVPAFTPQPTASYNYGEQYYAQRTPYKVNRFSIGIEGFWDRYREPIADLESDAGYGAVDASWSHYFSQNWYSTAELRGSYGKEHYSSISGTISGIDQSEFEARQLIGYDTPVSDGAHVRTYIGFGERYYRDEGKGEMTNTGALAYDRRIFQLMLPIGITYDMVTSSGYHFAPTIEGGPLLFGNVSTRLQNIPGFDQLSNQQHSGYELRGDFMVSKLNAAGRGFEFGPFVRYYHMSDSDTDTIPAGTFIEPENSRLQVGAKLGYKF